MPIVAIQLSVWQHTSMSPKTEPAVEPEKVPTCTCKWLRCAPHYGLGQVMARIPMTPCEVHSKETS